MDELRSVVVALNERLDSQAVAHNEEVDELREYIAYMFQCADQMFNDRERQRKEITRLQSEVATKQTSAQKWVQTYAELLENRGASSSPPLSLDDMMSYSTKPDSNVSPPSSGNASGSRGHQSTDALETWAKKYAPHFSVPSGDFRRRSSLLYELSVAQLLCQTSPLSAACYCPMPIAEGTKSLLLVMDGFGSRLSMTEEDRSLHLHYKRNRFYRCELDVDLIDARHIFGSNSNWNGWLVFTVAAKGGCLAVGPESALITSEGFFNSVSRNCGDCYFGQNLESLIYFAGPSIAGPPGRFCVLCSRLDRRHR